jgi:hypothetical protein
VNKLIYDAAMHARPARSQTSPSAAAHYARACSAETIARLEALASALAPHGWTTRLHAPRGQMPSLHARNPEPGAAALSEYIYAQPRADGTWTYWWPWAEPIAEAPASAAAVIVHALRPAGKP